MTFVGETALLNNQPLSKSVKSLRTVKYDIPAASVCNYEMMVLGVTGGKLYMMAD
jgi:hypothetical protein